MESARIFGARAPLAQYLRPILNLSKTQWCNRSFEQVRGKKKSSKQPVVVKVRLLKDVPRYGRRGAIIPIAAGRMRNDWYPGRVAEYMTDSALRGLNLQDTIFERDFAFQPLQKHTEPRAIGKEEGEDQDVKVDIQLLSPDRTAHIIMELIPSTLLFYRQPVGFLKSDGKGTQADSTEPINTYGSVSSLDIVKYIKAKLDESPEGDKVVQLSPDDVKFTNNLDENDPDRVKKLGDFTIEIQVKGALEPLQRTIRVLPETAD